MIIQMLANAIKVKMFIGICDFEYLSPQDVIVSVKAQGEVVSHPQSISECLDYSKVCNFVKSWEKRKHVDLVETLLIEVHGFCFAQDIRINKVEVKILKPSVIDYVESVGVSSRMTREEFNLLSKFEK